MQHLTLVGLSEDKKRLLLVSDSGEEYSLAADDKLRAALRGDLARLGQLEIQMDSALRPRDIQARIRAGESPETVAQAAQTTVERIMRYASPVLAERAHIAERAQRASVRRKASEGPARILGEVVSDQLRGENVDPESVDWDAWRREDGRWTLVADFRVTERPKKAQFIFDIQGRYVVADDDDARWLVGEATVRKPRQPRTPTPNARRLSPVVTSEEELPLGDDAIEMVSAGEEPGAEDNTVDLTQTAWEVRRPERRQARKTDRRDRLTPAGDADWMATQASERPAGRRSVPPEEPPGPGPEAVRPASAAPEHPAALDATPASAPQQDEAVEPEEPAKPAKKSARKGRRASVPSWDEIMFGGGRSD